MLVQNLDREILNDFSINQALFEELLEAQRELGLLHGTRPTCPFLRPHFLSRSQYQKIIYATNVLAKAFERLAEAALQDKILLSLLGLTEKEERMARVETGYKTLCVTSRLDSFLSEDSFKFLEYNAESPAGLADQMQLEKVLMRVPPVRELLSRQRHWTPKPHERLLKSLIAAYRESDNRKEHPQIGIIDWKGVSTESEFYVLKDYFESRGVPTIVADPNDLDFDGEHLYANGFRIDIFYKRVIIHEFLEKFDDTHPLVRAYIANKVCMANSFRVKIAHKKAGFAILSDERYSRLFTKEQQEMIHYHIPWTRRVRDVRTTFEDSEIELMEFLRKNRERFVIKPNDDYGGHGIHIGWETEPCDWEAALNDALAKDYVAQERVPIKKLRLPVFSDKVEMVEMLVDFNPFVFPEGAEGALIRLSTSSLVNITQGGGQTALVVLE
jgi:hypothetical protein